MLGGLFFPFEGDLQVVPLNEPVLPEPPRSGEDGGLPCPKCEGPDRFVIWRDGHLRLKAFGPSGLPFVAVLEPREHPANDPDWMRYYDQAQHQGDTGHALWDLAVRQGEAEHEAASTLASAVAGHTETYVRSRAMSGIKLASLIGRHHRTRRRTLTYEAPLPLGPF
jgi:hypothetical protein